MSNESFNIKLKIQFDHKVNVWVLQLGGWLPLQLSSTDIILIDKNISSTLATLANLQSPLDESRLADKWWLEKLNVPSPALNPVLCAMEGRWRTSPSFDQFCAELERIGAFLQKALPNATIIRHQAEILENIYEVYTSQLPRYNREQVFLLEACPLVASRVKLGHEAKIEEAIFSAAEKAGISRQSLCCITVLSALYEPIDGSEPIIGRRVLKPKAQYTPEQAFNALADIHALEFLATGQGLGAFKAGFCTRDKHLAALWVNLDVSSPTIEGNTFSASYNPKPDIFPRLDTNEITDLMQRTQHANR